MNSSRQYSGSNIKYDKNINQKSLIFFFCCLLFTVCCLFPYGCGGPETPTLSVIHTKAIEYNQNGMKAADKGNYEKALEYYMEALKVNRSIENLEGIAVNLINIAVIYQKKGDVSQAHQFIDTALLLPDINDAVRSEAAFEKARLYLRERKITEANEWANKSLSLNKGARDGSRWNLLGRAALIEGRFDEALNLTSNALKLSRESGQKTEEANSLRLIAEIKAQTDRYEESRDSYMRAMEIDKQLGDSKKIAMDLSGLGELAIKYNRLQDAIIFLTRAYNVSMYFNDTGEILKVLDRLSEVHRKSGNEKKSEEIMKIKNDFEKKK